MIRPLPWPVLAGSPVDLARAKINFALANCLWAGSMTSEVFDGVVTFCTDCLFAAMDEYSAATKRVRSRMDQSLEGEQ